MATVVQDDVRNTYVGIRVESPGERGPIGQSSNAEAETTQGGAITVATDGIDTVVIADIVAPELTLPVAVAGATTVWEWIWVWSADEATLDDAAARLVSGDELELDVGRPARWHPRRAGSDRRRGGRELELGLELEP